MMSVLSEIWGHYECVVLYRGCAGDETSDESIGGEEYSLPATEHGLRGGVVEEVWLCVAVLTCLPTRS